MKPQSIITGLSLVLATVFATLYFANPRIKELPVEKIMRVEVPVTNEVQKTLTVTNEVLETIEVPIPIPQEYILSHALATNLLNAPSVEQKQLLKGINGISVIIQVSEKLRDFVDDQSIRTKIELNLRKSGITIDDSSSYFLICHYKGFQDSTGIFVFSYIISLAQNTYFHRPGGFVQTMATIWQSSYFGSVGKYNLKSNTIQTTEQLTEEFLNDYLSVNQKPRE